jgi:hypothetical protein
MIDYGNWNGQRRQRRRFRPGAVTITVLIVAVGGYVAARHWTAAAAPPRPLPVASVRADGGRPAVTVPAGQLALGACLDPTTSLVASFPVAIRRDLALAVASLAPVGELPTSASPGQPVSAPQPAVDLVIRQVDTRSYSTDATGYTTEVSVPGVPGLASSRPDPRSASYDTQLGVWSRGYEEVLSARHAAALAAVTGSRAIAALPLDRRTSNLSGISACVSALLLTAPRAGRHSYLLASDLQEDVAPQLAGSFHGAPLVIVQACDTGNAAYCQGLLQQFSVEMHRLHVGQITVIRPEVAEQAIRDWVQTGGSNP